MLNTKVNLHGTISSKKRMSGNLNTGIEKIYPSIENLDIVPSGEQQIFTHEGSYGYDKVTVKGIELQDKTVTPNTKEQVIVADDNYSGLNQVTVKPIPDSYVEPTGTLEITENGTHDVTNYKEVKADIHEPTPFAPPFISFYRSTEGDGKIVLTQDVIDSIDTSNIKSMSYMFSKSNTNLKVLDLSKWNFENVVDMSYMFSEASNFAGVIFGNANTRNVKTMSYMLNKLYYASELDLSGLDTSSVVDMSYMFNELWGIKKLILSNFNTSNVTNMSYMFYWGGYTSGNSNILSLDLSSFDISKVTNMSYMFNGSKFTTINLGNSSADTLRIIGSMFSSCSKLTNLTFFRNLGKGYTQKTTNYSNYALTLSGATNLTHDSLMDVINKLYDLNLTYDVANGGTLYSQKLVLGAANLSKLTADEIAIATNKGWVVS